MDVSPFDYAFDNWRKTNAYFFKDKCSDFLSEQIKGSRIHSALLENIAYLVKNGETDLDGQLNESQAICFLDYFHEKQKGIEDVFLDYINDC